MNARRIPPSLKVVTGLLTLAICLAGCTGSDSKKSSSSPASPTSTSSASSIKSTTPKAAQHKAVAPTSLAFAKMTKRNATRLQQLVPTLRGVQNVAFDPVTKQFEVYLVKTAKPADVAVVKAIVQRQVMTK